MTSKTYTYESKGTTSIEINYSKEVRQIVLDADGIKIETDKTEVVEYLHIVVKVDGKFVTESYSQPEKADSRFPEGCIRINRMVCNPTASAAVLALIAEVMAEENTVEVVKAEAADMAATEAFEIAEAAEIVRIAEKQGKMMTAVEYRRWSVNYNNAINEGTQGHIPTMITREQYEAAKARLTR